MKTSPLLALLKYHLGLAWPFLLVSLFYGGFFAYQQGQLPQDHMFFLSRPVQVVFLYLVPFMNLTPIFTQVVRTNPPGSNPFGTLEFFFTRAIARTSLFWLRTALFLVLTIIPLVVVWASSYTRPDLRLQLPTGTAFYPTTSQFFLTHFDGAYLQNDDRDPAYKKTSVVLPQGQVDISAYTFVTVLTGILLIQVVSFAFFPPRPWHLFATLIAVMLVTEVDGTPLGWPTPTPYEIGVAWVNRHLLVSFFTLALLTLLAQLYCRHRFVTTEILS